MLEEESLCFCEEELSCDAIDHLTSDQMDEVKFVVNAVFSLALKVSVLPISTTLQQPFASAKTGRSSFLHCFEDVSGIFTCLSF